MEDLATAAWAALIAGDEGVAPAPLPVTGPRGHLPARHPVEEAAVAAIGTALRAAAAFLRREPELALDRGHVAAAVRSEAHFRGADRGRGPGFALLSRFWPAADGWIRTHANYPWHRDALLRALGSAPDEDAVAAAVAGLPALEVEERVVAAGGVAAAVRAPEEWRRHPQGEALAAEPLIAHRTWSGADPRARPAADLPLRGVRVLDLTRVIAGPVCTRFLGALGADVLRLDPPHHPDMPPGTAYDTLLGKRSALLDLRAAEGLAALHGLLDGADVLVAGYRPGALDRFGISPEELAARHPGLVTVVLDAWGHHGPWAGRRGFDSIVQAASGIAVRESADGERPGALPCQLLDHGTGYLAAAAAIDGLRRQAAAGGTHARWLSLARTARWLMEAPEPEAAEPPPASGAAAWTVELDGPEGPISAVAPPGRLDGRPMAWPAPLSTYGADAPDWSSGERA